MCAKDVEADDPSRLDIIACTRCLICVFKVRACTEMNLVDFKRRSALARAAAANTTTGPCTAFLHVDVKIYEMYAV